MKPFNLEAAKNGAPICTRKGTPVKFIAHVSEVKEDCRIVCATNDEIQLYYEDGRLFKGMTHENDLVMESIKRTIWINLFAGGTAFFYDSKQRADDISFIAHRLYDRAFPLEIEE